MSPPQIMLRRSSSPTCSMGCLASWSRLELKKVRPRLLFSAIQRPAKGAVLNVRQHRPHPGLGLLVGQHPGAGDVLAELGGVGDGVVHGGHAALVDEVDDELHLVDALEIGVFRGVTGFHQRLEAALHQIHHAAAQNGLLAEEVGLGLIVEGGLHDARPGAADAGDVGQRDLVGPAGGVLLHGHQTGHALAGNIGGADGVAGALGRRHEHVHTGGRHDLLVADVEAVGKGQGVAFLQIGAISFL